METLAPQALLPREYLSVTQLLRSALQMGVYPVDSNLTEATTYFLK